MQAPVSVVAKPSPESESLLTWNDPAGFTFQYPQGLTVDKHDEDTQNYAHIEFTHKDHQGNVIVWGKDTIAKDAAAWVKAEKRLSGGNTLDTTLGAVLAKKVLVATPTAMVVTAAVSDQIAFSVEATLTDREFWSGIHDTIVRSFAFTPVGGEKAMSPNAGTGVSPAEEVVDEEEVVE